MLVQLESADPRVSVEEAFPSLQIEEKVIETVSTNFEYISVAEVDSLQEVIEASETSRIIVDDASEYRIDYKITEYNHYVE